MNLDRTTPSWPQQCFNSKLDKWWGHLNPSRPVVRFLREKEARHRGRNSRRRVGRRFRYRSPNKSHMPSLCASDAALPTSKVGQPQPDTPMPVLCRLRPPLCIDFHAIIRHGSIRRAAEALHSASSALNRRVPDLEREAGTILFDRLRKFVGAEHGLGYLVIISSGPS
jgi:hypothetical protein